MLYVPPPCCSKRALLSALEVRRVLWTLSSMQSKSWQCGVSTCCITALYPQPDPQDLKSYSPQRCQSWVSSKPLPIRWLVGEISHFKYCIKIPLAVITLWTGIQESGFCHPVLCSNVSLARCPSVRHKTVRSHPVHLYGGCVCDDHIAGSNEIQKERLARLG